MTTSADLFKLLGHVRKVQRKLELLKPVIDKACDEVQDMAVQMERIEAKRKMENA